MSAENTQNPRGSINQYVYTPQEAGMENFPSGTLRLEGIEVTTNPDDADLFILPCPLCKFEDDRRALERLPHIKGRENRLVCFDVSDWDTVFTANAMLIRCNMKRFMQDANPLGISWSWPVDDFSECIDLPASGFLYDISFHGWSTPSKPREEAPQSCLNSSLKCDIAMYRDFCGYIYETTEGVRRRREFRRSMKESRVALCPESIAGVFPYRFFEAMSAGRVPLLVGSNYVLPLADEIPYADFMLTCPASEASKAADVALAFIGSHPDEQIVEMGQQARACWVKWLNRVDWPRTMAYAVLKKLQ